ncbi:ABC transporter permease [Nocardioides sp. NPDC057772]|uniref:ABC transporter permease n=1 Tax=Nocardioides sp. NPDC057772 TaxID=3346245 RepID=UPI0002028A08|nr:ABC-2 type transporter superfamily [Nocardioidaceae bacterium Broad-1]
MTALGLAPVVRAPGRTPTRLGLFGSETAKGLRLAWHRKGTVVVGIVLNTLTYLGISLFIGGGHIVEELMVLTLPALLAVTIAETAAVNGSGGIAEEINGGTLEQTRLSPAPAYLQALGRMAALAVEGLLAAGALAVVFTTWFDLDYDWSTAALLPAALTAGLTVLNAVAYGLLMVGLTLRVASIGAITHVFNMAIMFFGGMLVPVTVFPDGIETLSHLIPTALGVQALNTTMSSTGSSGLDAAWADGTLPWLLVHTSVLIVIGLATYHAAMRRALREGGLSPR